MKRFGIAVTTLICIGLSAVLAQAAAVHYTFDETAPGSWDVYVQVTGEDTDGLSAYAIWVDPSAGVSYVENTLSVLNALYQPIGFLSPVAGDVAGKFSAGNSQGVATAILGIGKTAVYMAPPVGVPTPPVDLGVPALLGTLTTPTGMGLGDLYPGPAGTGLFNAAGDGYLSSLPTPTFDVNPIPEPVTLTLLGLGGLALLIRRRR